MARHVFFSFHYQDVIDFRANVVRNSGVFKKGDIFYDKSLWESVQTKQPQKIKNLIQNGLYNTSVTAVLIGSETHNRRWVKYEIFKSFEDGNGLFGIRINRIRNKYGEINSKGLNPFDRLGLSVSKDGKIIYCWELVNGKWLQYQDLLCFSNKKSNTRYFKDKTWFWETTEWDTFYKLSELFPTYCWTNDEGKNNFVGWVEEAAKQAGR